MNQIGDEGIEVLCKLNTLRIRKIDLRKNDMIQATIKYFRQVSPLFLCLNGIIFNLFPSALIKSVIQVVNTFQEYTSITLKKSIYVSLLIIQLKIKSEAQGPSICVKRHGQQFKAFRQVLYILQSAQSFECGRHETICKSKLEFHKLVLDK